MKYFYSLMLCASLMFTSCTEGSDSAEELKLADGIPTEIVVGEDGTADVKEIKFEASSSWTAMVRNVSENHSGGSEVEWLELDMYNGQAGENTIKLSIKKNETSESRKAEIVIQCGSSTITIIVEQYMRSDGNQGGGGHTDNELLKTLEISTNDGSGEAYSASYTYDNNDRVLQIIGKSSSANNNKQVYTMTYTSDNRMKIEDVNGTDVKNYIADLNDNGDVVCLYSVESSGEVKDYDFKYDSDGRLLQIKSYYNDGKLDTTEDFIYENGLFKEYKYEDYKEAQDSESCSYFVDIENGYSNKYPNNECIDVMAFILPFQDDYTMLFHIGVLGKSGDYVPEAATIKMKNSESVGKTDTFHCEFDNKNRMTKLIVNNLHSSSEDIYTYKFSY